MPKQDGPSFEEIVLGLAKGAAIAMFVYLFLKLLVLIHGKHWTYLGEPWGAWYLVEVIGFVAAPAYMFVVSVKHRSVGVARTAAILTLIGIILNRLNVSIIAFNWNVPARYFPSWMEIEITLMIVFAEIWVFRWVVNRMPVLREAEPVAVAAAEA